VITNIKLEAQSFLYDHVTSDALIIRMRASGIRTNIANEYLHIFMDTSSLRSSRYAAVGFNVFSWRYKLHQSRPSIKSIER
jgi:hypothetical protein